MNHTEAIKAAIKPRLKALHENQDALRAGHQEQRAELRAYGKEFREQKVRLDEIDSSLAELQDKLEAKSRPHAATNAQKLNVLDP